MTTDPSPFRIAIIGAGPAGCTLARLLLRANVPTSIFEGEVSLDMRAQGGTLDLHDDTGIAALREAGLYDEFFKFARFDGDAMVVCDKKMLRYINMKSTKEGSWLSQTRPEIDRMQLRRLLLDSLPDGIVHWGHRLRSIDPQDLSLHFEHGVVERGFDLVVGADGAFSKVRPLLTHVRPHYSGVGGYSMLISDAEQKHPTLYRLVNRGSFFSISDGKMVIGQQMGDGSIYVSAYGVCNEDWMREASYDVSHGPSVKAALCDEYRDWSPQIKDLFKAVDDDKIWARPLYMLPPLMRWENRPGVTLLGDAAHLMTPFAGEGVNTAMRDAMELAHAIQDASEKPVGKEELTRKIKRYEEDMFKRAGQVQALTDDVMKLMLFTEGAPRTVVEKWMNRIMRDQLHIVLLTFLKITLWAATESWSASYTSIAEARSSTVPAAASLFKSFTLKNNKTNPPSSIKIPDSFVPSVLSLVLVRAVFWQVFVKAMSGVNLWATYARLDKEESGRLAGIIPNGFTNPTSQVVVTIHLLNWSSVVTLQRLSDLFPAHIDERPWLLALHYVLRGIFEGAQFNALADFSYSVSRA
ncbi:MAG: hypothetical protein M1816_007013 [Peltula sp. TS41687]|nr:MAG: hypothetical protein M1816_007013 [Peltula sp. TS41687]